MFKNYSNSDSYTTTIINSISNVFYGSTLKQTFLQGVQTYNMQHNEVAEAIINQDAEAIKDIIEKIKEQKTREPNADAALLDSFEIINNYEELDQPLHIRQESGDDLLISPLILAIFTSTPNIIEELNKSINCQNHFLDSVIEAWNYYINFHHELEEPFIEIFQNNLTNYVIDELIKTSETIIQNLLEDKEDILIEDKEVILIEDKEVIITEDDKKSEQMLSDISELLDYFDQELSLQKTFILPNILYNKILGNIRDKDKIEKIVEKNNKNPLSNIKDPLEPKHFISDISIVDKQKSIHSAELDLEELADSDEIDEESIYNKANDILTQLNNFKVEIGSLKDYKSKLTGLISMSTNPDTMFSLLSAQSDIKQTYERNIS